MGIWVQSCVNTHTHTHANTHARTHAHWSPLPSGCQQLWKAVRPDWHSGLPPRMLSLSLWGVKPHGRRWRDPPAETERNDTFRADAHTHTHNMHTHACAIIRWKATNWLAWQCVNTNWMQGSSCCSKHFSRQRKRSDEEGRARVSEWVSDCVLNKESCLQLRRPPCWQPITCVESRRRRSPPAPSHKPPVLLSGPVSSQKRNWTMLFPVGARPAAWEAMECLPFHNRCHLYPRRIGAPPPLPPIQIDFYSLCPSVTFCFLPSESAVRWNWAAFLDNMGGRGMFWLI